MSKIINKYLQSHRFRQIRNLKRLSEKNEIIVQERAIFILPIIKSNGWKGEDAPEEVTRDLL